MKSVQKAIISLFACSVVAANSHAGRWLSRDPIQEGAGFVQRDPASQLDLSLFQQEAAKEPNLYAFVGNCPLCVIDPLGLATLRFEVVRGQWRGITQLAGTWSQPWWAGSGSYNIWGNGASSTVSLNNEPSFWEHLFNVSGYCNRVWWLNTDDPHNIVGNAGAIKVWLKDDCGGKFRVNGMFFATLYGNGPEPIYAMAWLYSSTDAVLSKGAATQNSPLQTLIGAIDEVITLRAGEEKLVTHYEPYLRFNRSVGSPSYGTAQGNVTISGVTKVQ